MKRIGTIGLTLGLAALAGAGLLFAMQPAGGSEAPLRVWNLIRWLGLVLPDPGHPTLMEPTLAVLNLPLWQAAAGIGLVLIAVSLLFGRKPRAAVEPSLVLNGLAVDPRIEALMRRSDWAGERTDEAWMARFPAHGGGRVTFVQFCPPEWAVRENKGLRDPNLAVLLGAPDADNPPGDVDPTAAYLIGFTDAVDSGIFVDLRGGGGGRIIYDNLGPTARHVVAFETIDEFVTFYRAQHGH